MSDIFLHDTPEDNEKFDSLQCEYDLEDCGMSGQFPGWHWWNDEAAGLNVYTR